MNCSAQDFVDAIITAAVRRGSDGRGKHGLDGRMFTLARTERKRFGRFLGWALRLKMKAGRDKDDERPKSLAEEEAYLRERGIPVEVLQFTHRYHPELPVTKPPESAGPSGTRDLMEAVVNAAIRHGSDGRGKNGLVGYMLLLERTEPKTFDMLTGVVQRWQASRPDRPNKPKPRPTEEEILAEMRALGMDVDGYLQWESRRRGPVVLDPDEVEDPYSEEAKELRVSAALADAETRLD
jgi:hypothetical protein